MITQELHIDVASELGAFLSSRTVASHLRRRVQMRSAPVSLDFSGVQSISDSFADEFFAVLVQEKGPDWFAANIITRGLSRDVRHTTLRAIHARCECEPV